MALKQKYSFIEIARVMCIFVVVFVHTLDMATAAAGNTALTLALSPGLRFVVPAFFMISGLLLGLRHRDPHYRVDARVFWSRRAHTLILPFFVWNIVYMIILVIIPGNSIFDGDTLFNVTTGYMHLYFVIVLVQCLVLYTLLAKFFSARLLRVSVAIAALSSFAFYAVSQALLWTVGPDDHLFEWRLGKLVFGWALFFFWGIWLGYEAGILERLTRYRFWLLAAAVVAFVPYWLSTVSEFTSSGTLARDYFLLGGLPYQFIAANAFLAFFYGWETRFSQNAFAQRLVGWGQYMFGVYVAHLALLLYLAPLWYQLLPTVPFAISIPCITVLTFTITLAFVKACGTPGLAFVGSILFGGRGKQEPARGTNEKSPRAVEALR